MSSSDLYPSASGLWKRTASSSFRTPPPASGAGGPLRLDIDQPPRSQPVLQALSFAFVLALAALQLLPATHFRHPADPSRSWMPFASRPNTSTLTKAKDPLMEQLNNVENIDVEIGRINVVTWMDCLDLRMLAVLTNSTLSSSSLSENVFFSLFVPESEDVKLSYYKLKVLLPDSNLDLFGTRSFGSSRVPLLWRFSIGCRFVASAAGGFGAGARREEGSSSEFLASAFPISGAEDSLLSFINGKRKATDVAHSIWKIVIRGGDTVVDATCGNGYDTVALLRLVADKSRRGCVHGLDIQNSALENTSYLLRESVVEEQRELVKLYLLCHSRMEDILPKDTPVRLIAFNLGYLPSGDKAIITKPQTTLLALQAASRIIASGGLISIVVYVGHPGGREELEAILSFSSSLPVECWNCFKFETANRPTGPVLVLIFKK